MLYLFRKSDFKEDFSANFGTSCISTLNEEFLLKPCSNLGQPSEYSDVKLSLKFYF